MTKHQTDLRIPFATLLKVALFVLLAYVVTRLWPLFLMAVVATLLAVVLAPIKHALERRGVRRWLAMTLVGLLLFGVVLSFLLVVVPRMATQVAGLVKQWPQLSKRITSAMPAAGPYVDSFTAEMQRAQPGQARQWMAKGLIAGRYALSGLAAIGFVLVLTLYFMVEGRRALEWLVTFAEERNRRRWRKTFDEVQPVMLAYMRGQLITSTLSAIVAISVLSAFRVPAAAPLAVLAFVGDFVPVAGFFASLVPAVLMSLLVSPTAAVSVAATYVAYQMLENYVIAPRVYGRQMDLSPLTVVLTVAVGGLLMGPLGSILFLPFAASYPTVEKIWLQEHLPEDAVERHEEIAEGTKT